MRLNLISQMINHYHKAVTDSSDEFVEEFPSDDYDSDVEDPLGGEEGITIYDRFDIDPDYGSSM